MPRSTKTEKKESSSAALDISPEQGDGEENDKVELSPAMAKAFQHMTETISKTIDVKLDPLAEIIHTHSQELENCKSRLDEAENRFAPRPGAKERPRPLVVRMHHFGYRQRILEASRKLSMDGNLRFENCKISFFQDFSASVLRKRREFDSVRRRLQEIGARYAMLYPAKLRVTIGNTTKILGLPTAVSEFIAETGQDVRPVAADSTPLDRPVMDE
ncbi:LINE-1 retrotransposable element ORF1 protein [Anabarilius grahami]|uniref:LINE-1 retrotransposable element ORF1 protein n=1 Tax=Anabarilius grahami TaxID=495550 RepID=A0A3N0YQ52_ANAGA|nr:LINE-1 retrotransposable element ORF1 protein [Anabarilius grahami]